MAAVAVVVAVAASPKIVFYTWVGLFLMDSPIFFEIFPWRINAQQLPHSERCVDFSGSAALVQGVEMDAVHSGVE